MKSEASHIYTIPANYTDSGRLAGFVPVRNALETFVLVLSIGYFEINFVQMAINDKIMLVIFTLLPVAIFGLIGIGGDSLGQYLLRIFGFLGRRKKYVFRRLGKYAQKEA